MTTFQAPERSREQRMEALALANATRSRRARLKRQLKRRERSLAEILTDPPEEAQSWHLLDALMACPRVGKVKAQKALRTAGVSPRKTLGEMTDRQANVLLRVLGAHDEMAPDGRYGGAREVRERPDLSTGRDVRRGAGSMSLRRGDMIGGRFEGHDAQCRLAREGRDDPEWVG